MRWTYHIEGRQVFPMNTRNYEIKNSLENSIIHAYRRTPPDTLTLQFDDYEYIKTLESDFRFEKFTLDVHVNGASHVKGEFTINDCSFDDYKNNCQVKITPRDIYTAIQENEDIEVNVIADRKEVIMERYSRWHFYCTRTTGAIGIADANSLLLEYAVISLFGIYVNLFVTELIEVDDGYGVPAGWSSTPFADLGDTLIYQRRPVNYNIPLIQDWFGSVDLSGYHWSGTLLGYHIPYDESLYDLINLSFHVPGVETDYSQLWIKKSYYNKRANMVFTQSYSGMELKSSLDRILDIACPDFTGGIKSGLLFGDIAETGMSYPVGYPMNSYGRYIIEMSDFRKPNASEQATKGILTLKQAIEYLCLKHNARWSIDTNGDFRIEHISYYDPLLTGLDLSATDVTLKYSYLQNDKPNRESLSESSGWNEDFDKIEVLYGTVPALNGIKESTKSTSLSTFYTDIDGLNNHLSELSNDGFVYVEAYTDTTPGGTGHTAGDVVKSTGFKSGETGLQNATLSNANCLNTYYRHRAYQQSFKIGGIDVEAISLKKQKVQEIIFTSEQIPDCTKLIQTRIGTGEIVSLSYKPTEENNFKATLVYE